MKEGSGGFLLNCMSFVNLGVHQSTRKELQGKDVNILLGML